MDAFWTLTFVFAATFALVQAAYALLVRPRAGRRDANRRLGALRGGGRPDAAPVHVRRAPWTGDGPAGAHGHLRKLVVQSGLHVGPPQALGVFASVALACAAGLWLMGASAVAALMGGAFASFGLIVAAFAVARGRRIARFSAQLPDVVDVMVRSLRAGHPVPRSLALVASEMSDPAGAEFAVAADELTYGSDLPTAMEMLYARVGAPDLRFLVVAISVQSATGGSLAAALGNLSSVMRQRFKLRRKVRALTAEGRYSALLLSALPVIFFLMLNLVSRDFYGEVWSDPNVPHALMAGGAMMLVGNIVMYRMVNYKV
ncbi:MAG: Flp pilus assembly protein TadB [Hyphomicrobiales bacterium]|nr:Flp pilus assembly protein TadB [Hyphomicrobiales bacterium]